MAVVPIGATGSRFADPGRERIAGRAHRGSDHSVVEDDEDGRGERDCNADLPVVTVPSCRSASLESCEFVFNGAVVVTGWPAPVDVACHASRNFKFGPVCRIPPV